MPTHILQKRSLFQSLRDWIGAFSGSAGPKTISQFRHMLVLDCYNFCYRGFPKILFADPVAVITSLEKEGAPLLQKYFLQFLNDGTGRELEAPRDGYSMFSLEARALEPSLSALLISYPAPPPLGNCPTPASLILGPHFSAVLFDPSNPTTFTSYVLGQSLDGGTTLRQVLGERRHVNCGPGCGPTLEAFASLLKSCPHPVPILADHSSQPPIIPTCSPSEVSDVTREVFSLTFRQMSYHFCDYGLPQKLFDAPNSDIETLLMAGASHLRVFANDNLPSFLTSYSSSALPPDFFAQFAMHVSQISSSVSAIIITYPPPNPPDFTALLYEPKDLKRIAVYVLGETIGNYTALWLVRGRGKSGNCANEGTPTQFAILRWCDPLDERHGPTLEDFISILRSEINS